MSKTKHIVVIRLSAMGDVAMTVPVLRALVAQHPNAQITMVSKEHLAPVFESLKTVRFFGVDVKNKHKGLLGLWRLFRELQKEEITHVADLHNVLRSKILRLFFRFSLKKVAAIDKGRAEKKALTRSKNKVFKQLKSTHQRYADVFKQLGFLVDLSNPTPLKQPILSNKITNITGSKEAKKWIGIAPFAQYESKTYPLDLMEKVIEQLCTNYHLFLFGGGQKEIDVLTSLEKKYTNAVCVAGQLNLKEELDLIAHLDLMLAMDSGNAHFAAMQQIKTITLWGVTHPFAGFAPFGQPLDYCILPDLKEYPNIPCSVYGNKICEGYDAVMRSIKPSAITNKILTIVN